MKSHNYTIKSGYCAGYPTSLLKETKHVQGTCHTVHLENFWRYAFSPSLSEPHLTLSYMDGNLNLFTLWSTLLPRQHDCEWNVLAIAHLPLSPATHLQVFLRILRLSRFPV